MSNVDFLPDLKDTLTSLVPLNEGRDKAPRFNTLAIKNRIVIYHLTSAHTEKHVKAAMAALTLCGRCDDERPAAWQSLVLTWSVLCFPELVDTLKNDSTSVDYTFSVLSDDFLNSASEAMKAHAQESEDTFVSFPSNLPDASTVPVTAELVAACQVEGLYAYYAMLVFVLGKSLSPESMVALTTKRPSALIRKRMLENCEYILVGEGKPAMDNYKRIQSGWIRSTRPRISIVTHLANLVSADNRSESLDTICVNMEMLKNSGQTYMYYIHELFVACPWCLTIPAVRSAYYHYVRIVKTLAEQPEWFRPYYKLAYQDATSIVRRKDIEPLIGIATFYAAQTRKTMSKYRINNDTIPLVQAFHAMAQEHGVKFTEITNQQTTEISAV